MSNLSGWSHSGDCTRVMSPTSSLSQPSFSPPQPLSWAFWPHKRHLSNHLFCSIEPRKCISRYHWVSSSICESLHETSISATFYRLWASWPTGYSLGFKGTSNRRSSSSSGSSRRKDCWHAITREATSTSAVSLSGERQVLRLLWRHQAWRDTCCSVITRESK